MRRAAALNGQCVNSGLESVVEDFAGLRFGEIPEHHRVFKIHGRR